MKNTANAKVRLWFPMSFLARLLFAVLAAAAAGVILFFWEDVDWPRVVWYQLVTGVLLGLAGGGIVGWGIATFLSVEPSRKKDVQPESREGNKP